MRSPPIRVFLADDEPLALRRLRLGVSQMSDVEIVGTAADGETALRLIDELKPDVVLLDIKMPGLSGLDLAQRLTGDHAPAVIFVSAFGRFAVDAFEAAAVDYVLKPIEYERLHRAIERARRTLHDKRAFARIAEFQAVIDELRSDEGARGATYDRELWVRSGKEEVRLRVETIEWIQAEGDYIRIHTPARNYYLRGSLRALEASLDPAQFARVHRSFLVRQDRVAKLRRDDDGALFLQMTDGAEIPVARRFRVAARRFSRSQ